MKGRHFCPLQRTKLPHKEMKKNFRAGYRGLVCLTLLMLASAILLSSCGGGVTAAPSAKDVTAAPTAENIVEFVSALLVGKTDDEGNYTLSGDEGAYTAFIAATNGFDITVEGFDDSKVYVENSPSNPPDAIMPAEGEERLALIRKVLKSDTVAPTGEAVREAYSALVDTITEEQIGEIVTKCQTKVDLTTARGLMGTIMYWIGRAMYWMGKLVGNNYIITLFVFAVVVELLMFPLSIKQQKNSIKQAKLRPKEMAIRNRYKGRNDQATQQKINTEIQEMYQQENFSPFGGCLPMLVQFPVIIILYQLVLDPLQYMLGRAAGLSNALRVFCTSPRAAGGLGLSLNSTREGTIELVSLIRKQGMEVCESLKNFKLFSNGGECFDALNQVSADLPDFDLFGLNLGEIPSISNPSWLWLVPVLTFVAYFASMKINRRISYQPTTADDKQVGCSNTVMDVMMPMFSVYISFLVPAAIGVYWIFKSLLGVAKQFVMVKIMPIPVYTEEDYKAAEREYLGKQKKVKTKANIGSASGVPHNPNSLFYTDDVDYVPEVEEEKTLRQAEQTGPIETAPLKDESDKKKNNKK